MRENDEAEKEKIVKLMDEVIAMRDSMNLDMPTFINVLVNLIGWSLPPSMDEEEMREMMRIFHKMFVEIQKITKTDYDKL